MLQLRFEDFRPIDFGLQKLESGQQGDAETPGVLMETGY
jgi:hypothetical protein